MKLVFTRIVTKTLNKSQLLRKQLQQKLIALRAMRSSKVDGKSKKTTKTRQTLKYQKVIL